MGRRRKGNIINGWINLYKPEGVGSTEAVGRVRRALNAQKVGHGGTLDPLASGVLPIALGEATKTIAYCQDNLKTYSFSIRWGESRTTDDAEGEVLETSDIRPDKESIQSVLEQFTGEIEQLPPRFSAIKVGGERAYDLARSGKEVKLEPRPVYVEELTLLETKEDSARFFCLCGKGTYMRSLARDIAVAVGTVGYITDLVRESVGCLDIKSAISLDKFDEIDHSAALDEVLLPVETVLDDIPALALEEREAARLKNGQKLLFISRPDLERLEKAGIETGTETEALAVFQGKPIALIGVKGAEIQPLRVLNL